MYLTVHVYEAKIFVTHCNDTTADVTVNGSTTAATITNGDVCTLVSEALERPFILACIAPSLILILVTSFFRKRVQSCKSCLDGRPGVNYPIDFLHDNGRRWAYAAAFGIITYRMMDLVEGRRYVRPREFDNPQWMSKYQFTTSLVGLFNILLVALVFYPFLVFIVLRRNIISNILGLIYIIIWFSPIVIIIVRCARVTVGYSAETTSTLREILSDIPMVICFVVLIFAYIFDLVVNVRNLLKQTDRKAAFRYSFTFGEPLHIEEHIEYVQALLKRPPKQPPTTIKEKIKDMFTYERVPGFRYSTRLLCTVTVTAIGLYKIFIAATVWLNFMLDVLAYYTDTALVPGLKFSNNTAMAKMLTDLVHILPVTFNISNVMALLLQIVGLVLLVLNYRRNLNSLMKGDRSWFFANEVSPANRIVAFWKFSGYQVVSSVYSYVIFLLMLWLVLVGVTYALILPIRDGTTNWLIQKILQLWPTLVISLALYYGQVLAAKFIFLDERGSSLAIVNRRVFHVTTFFMFFSNILLGIFGIVKRIVMGMVFGLLMLNRLDRCLLMRGWESFDAGFKSYLGMLEVDVHHNHPIVRVFAHLVQERIHEKHIGTDTDAEKYTPIVESKATGKDEAKAARHKAVLMKWQKAITLLHNPTILLERLERKARAKQRAKAQAKAKKADESELRDMARDVAGVGAVALVGTAVAGTAQAGVDLVEGMTDGVIDNAMNVSDMLDV